jgi:hypothetical protein
LAQLLHRTPQIGALSVTDPPYFGQSGEKPVRCPEASARA